ncbi:MAG TPA: hypothetical protein VKV40_21855 [Ktedonobacteraceae bacterium]|nr:hypothetical protein [Ktedonobacteraceae bacterium]
MKFFLRYQLDRHKSAVALAFSGFLHPVKGLETILTAFQQVREHHPQACLLLIGGIEGLARRACTKLSGKPESIDRQARNV